MENKGGIGSFGHSDVAKEGVQELQVWNFAFSIFVSLPSAYTVSREFAGARLPPPATPELL
jgi:hypothetical protein